MAKKSDRSAQYASTAALEFERAIDFVDVGDCVTAIKFFADGERDLGRSIGIDDEQARQRGQTMSSSIGIPGMREALEARDASFSRLRSCIRSKG